MFMSMILIANLGLIIVGEVCGMEFFSEYKSYRWYYIYGRCHGFDIRKD